MGLDSEFHDPTDYERRLIDRLLSVPFQGRDQVRDQARSARVRWISNAAAPALIIQPSAESKTANVSTRVPTDATGRDSDGGEIFFLLHVVDGRLSEIEVYRGDGEPIQKFPPPETVKVMNY